MADFAKRPEVTVNTMGKVKNPSGEGVRAISTQVKAKTAKIREATEAAAADEAQPLNASAAKNHHNNKDNREELPETKIKEGTAKRNITRKKTDGRDTGNYDSRNKKQGGHGKGQWKDVGLEGVLEDDLPEFSERDPLFDDHQKAYILSSGQVEEPESNPRGFDPIAKAKIYGPILTLPEYKIQVAATLKEYFDSCDADEVVRSLGELKCQEYHPEVVKKAVSLSLDQSPRERELVSRLLTCLHPSLLSHADMEAGFTLLRDSLADLSMDVPDAKTMVASFVARAVVDEVLPPAFLSEQQTSRPNDVVVEKAVTLLSREHCTARLERVWGPGDGRPVVEVKQEMDQLLKEYLLSRELDEGARCVRELNVPHFHHELVKRGVVIAMDQQSNDDSLDAMAALFTFLVNNAIISEYQVKKGIDRLHKILPDVSLDVPTAANLLAEFENLMLRENGGCLASPTGMNEVAIDATKTSNGDATKHTVEGAEPTNGGTPQPNGIKPEAVHPPNGDGA